MLESGYVVMEFCRHVKYYYYIESGYVVMEFCRHVKYYYYISADIIPNITFSTFTIHAYISYLSLSHLAKNWRLFQKLFRLSSSDCLRK